LIVSVAVLVVPFADAEMVTVPLGAVDGVATVKIAVICPASTVTLVGTVAIEVFALASVTT